MEEDLLLFGWKEVFMKFSSWFLMKSLTFSGLFPFCKVGSFICLGIIIFHFCCTYNSLFCALYMQTFSSADFSQTTWRWFSLQVLVFGWSEIKLLAPSSAIEEKIFDSFHSPLHEIILFFLYACYIWCLKSLKKRK